ncbi:DUF2470 domain-containing protein [Williamsia sp. CHRR-6]|uniref:DUF2470 domain-containing protein n=1 Tax=Williamsia sp. CHRR-6 TaxID=2835871 RepID=UPI001BDAF2E1|nr:DUF2470 domain-containing protein [Williamsia sp. CHRR-6]MBT0567623.1 DUF2470 domain-containing protein [Williamsia sp. CHRR-6]
MTETMTGRPTDAEAIATACMNPSAAMVALGVNTGRAGGDPSPVSMVHLFDDQAFLLVESFGAAVAALLADASGVPAMVEVTDLAPVALAERARSLVWLNGELHPVPSDLERDLAVEIAAEHPADELLDLGHGWSMLRLQLSGAVIATGSGAAAVSVDQLTRATPDPFWAYEAQWLTHLDTHHTDIIDRLAMRLPAHLRDGDVRPLGLDRHGIRLRVHDPATDVRLSFDRPVDDIAQLSHALRTLAGCPFPT